MSRVGKKPILIPEGVQTEFKENKIIVKGPKGELQMEILPQIKIEIKEGKIFVLPHIKVKEINALWGLERALIANMVKGVKDGYEKRLEVMGIGYKAKVEPDGIILEVGFSHPVKVKKPEGINLSVEKNIILISGIDKELVGQIAAKIRKVKVPEPYKGTGIKYTDEIIRRKAGKKVVTAGG